jgi:phosphoglycolate phosphatase
MNATALRSGPLPAFAGYLFDLDGTLVDTAPDINAALNLALADAGFAPVAESLTRHWVGHGAKVLVEEALSHFNAAPALVDELRDAFINHYERAIAAQSQPYPGVIETLTALRDRGSRLAVVTNKMTRLALPLLEELDLMRWFDCVVCGDTAARPKPAADPALHAANLLGLPIGELLFVGDSETDVLCARAAGCPVFCVADGYNHGIAPEALGADRIIQSFLDLVGAPSRASGARS